MTKDDGETPWVRRKFFSKLIWKGARPGEAQELADIVSTEEELTAVVFSDETEDVDEEMSREEAKTYRGISARLNYSTPQTAWTSATWSRSQRGTCRGR